MENPELPSEPTPATPQAARPSEPAPQAGGAGLSPVMMTAVVGVAMLLIGIMIGYFARPLVASQVIDLATEAETQEQVRIVVATPTPGAPAAAAPTSAEPPMEEPTDEERQAFMELLIEETRHFRGEPDAPVTIIEFSDFQCPYCGRFAIDAGAQIQAEYIDTGIARLGYRHFTFLGEQSVWAAEASECAADQDAFWPYHDFLVERLAIEQKRDFTRENLKAFAAELGLDTAAFGACMDSEKYAAEVAQATQQAQYLGVRSTPSFVINGEAVIGAQPFENFQQVIEAVRAE